MSPTGKVFTELTEKYGAIEEMNVCDNLGHHLVGNVFVKFHRDKNAESAVQESAPSPHNLVLFSDGVL